MQLIGIVKFVFFQIRSQFFKFEFFRSLNTGCERELVQIHSLYVGKFTRLFYQLIYTSLVGRLGSGAWSWVSIGLADKVRASVS